MAAGRSERFGGAVPKVLVRWRGRPLLAHALETLDRCDEVEHVVLVASETVEDAWRAAGAPGRKVARVVRGGATRQGSVGAGLAALPRGVSVVLVHDGARPFASAELFGEVVRAARSAGAALPVVAVRDTVKRVDPAAPGVVLGTVPRDELRLAQTPQGFRREVLEAAHAHALERGLDLTDDVAAVEAALEAGAVPREVRIAAIAGEEGNVKVTRPADVPAETAEVRVGLGTDVHPLARGRRFVLAGIDLQEGVAPGERFGPLGHSDGDALVHATCDALLGAAALGDIGQLYPDTADENEGRASMQFLDGVRERLAEHGWRARNVSAVLHLERPKVAPHALRLRQAIADALGIDVARVGLSAKRGEGLGDVGEGRAIRCEVVASIERGA